MISDVDHSFVCLLAICVSHSLDFCYSHVAFLVFEPSLSPLLFSQIFPPQLFFSIICQVPDVREFPPYFHSLTEDWLYSQNNVFFSRSLKQMSGFPTDAIQAISVVTMHIGSPSVYWDLNPIFLFNHWFMIICDHPTEMICKQFLAQF